MKYYEKCHALLNNIDKDQLRTQANYSKEKAGVFIEYVMNKAQKFNILDFTMFKVCLLSFGLWLGARFSKFFRKYKGILLFSFLVSYIFLIWRIFFYDDEK